MTEPCSDAEFGALTAKISRERGFGCASYKEKCLRRRIAVRMRARAVHTYTAYAHLLDEDAREYDLLLDALTINVSKLFRNWDTFEALDRGVIPAIWSHSDPALRIWSAGCAAGEEPYSLGILFHRYALAHDQPERLRRVSIVGTDIDRASLVSAERGAYAESAFADTPPELRRRYFSSAAPYTVHPEVRSLIRFERRDLLRETSAGGALHLIVCRNVIIYFDRDTQEALFQRFHDNLVRGGYLVLGKVETLLGPARARFAPVDARERIFQRL